MFWRGSTPRHINVSVVVSAWSAPLIHGDLAWTGIIYILRWQTTAQNPYWHSADPIPVTLAQPRLDTRRSLRDSCDSKTNFPVHLPSTHHFTLLSMLSIWTVKYGSTYIELASLQTSLKVIYHPLYSMNKFVTNKSKLPQDGAQVFPYMGWLAIMWPSERVTNQQYLKTVDLHFVKSE